jgi:hypothetical protein
MRIAPIANARGGRVLLGACLALLPGPGSLACRTAPREDLSGFTSLDQAQRAGYEHIRAIDRFHYQA